jgi:hypothetical protein
MLCRTCGKPISENDPHLTYHQDGRPDEYGCTTCDTLRRVGEYQRTGVVTTQLWTDATLINYDVEHGKGPGPSWAAQIVAAMSPVEGLGREWERQVWFGGEDRSQDDRYTEPYKGLEDMGHRQYKKKPEGHGTNSSIREDALPPNSLQAFVIPAEWKGYEAVVDGLKYMSYTLCGRSIFQIEDAKTGHFVSMITDEDSPTPRGGIRSIQATPAEATTFLIQAVADWKAGKIKLVHNENVGFGF